MLPFAYVRCESIRPPHPHIVIEHPCKALVVLFADRALATSAVASDKLPPLASSFSVLPTETLVDILLRFPAKDVCRLRAVCPSWRSLTSDPLFVKAHAARHKGPLLATTFVDGESCGVSIVDLLSGDVIKRIRTSDRGLRVQRTNLDHVCLVGRRNPLPVPVTVLNPATGAIISSSHHISDMYKFLLRRKLSMDSCAFGKVPSTGVYKALRFLQVCPPVYWNQLCEVMTLDDSGQAQWRAIQGPPSPVFSDNKMKSVVIDGVVYFLFDFSHRHRKYLEVAIKPASIAAFNLETEEWMANIDGPEPVMKFYGDDDGMLPLFDDPETVELLLITNLNGSLVIVQAVHGSFMELWFLTDFEKGLWVKKYSIRQYRRVDLCSYPLLVLDDERIVFIIQLTGQLQVYDPKTETYTDMWQLEDYKSVGIYTGNLLT